MVKWVFFDLGSTLLDDMLFHEHIYKVMIELFDKYGYKVKWEEFIEARDLFVVKRGPVLSSLVTHFTGSEAHVNQFMRELIRRIDGKGHELQRPRDESQAVLEALGGRYHLGIIANQQVGIHVLLKKLGWHKRFEIIMISDDIGIRKPDTRIFQMALEKASCQSSQTVMIGDRIDNDITPAKHLGMRTVRVKWGIFGRQEPLSEEEMPDFEIESLSDLPEILKRLS